VNCFIGKLSLQDAQAKYKAEKRKGRLQHYSQLAQQHEKLKYAKMNTKQKEKYVRLLKQELSELVKYKKQTRHQSPVV